MRRHAVYRVAILVIALFAVTCGSTPPTGPDPIVAPSITSITPATGALAGGTEVTIRGARFTTGATITIGGRAATDVRVQTSDVILAKTPAATTTGAVDVVVNIDGRTGMLASGFRYETTVGNTVPTIRSIAGQGTRTNQPPNFADHGETILITAFVEDAETAPAQLTYQWSASACGGTFTGTGPQVQWQAPTTGALPHLCTLGLTVTDGPFQVSSSVVIRLHDSATEVGTLALEFLEEFADSTIAAETTVRNFSNSCKGKSEELEDVTNNRATRVMDSHVYGPAKITVAFGATCRLGNRAAPGVDACVLTPVEWKSTIRPNGPQETAKGTSIISGVYRDSRWWLCDSLYDGNSSLGLHFMH